MAIQAKESFSVIIKYADGTKKIIDDVNKVNVYTNKTGNILCYTFTKENAIIYVPFYPATILSIDIIGTKDAKFIPDFY